jgi:hypothetical protein
MKIFESISDIDRTVIFQLKQIHSDPLIKMKKYDGAYTGIGPGLDKNGKPATGLTEDRKYRIPAGKKGAGQIKSVIGTRAVMEKELDLPEGELKASSSFWDRYTIRVGAEPVDLDLSDPHDLLKYIVAMAQSNVANGFDEIDRNNKAEYVIYSEEQEAAVRVDSRKALKKAYKISENLDIETKINILAIYGIIANHTDINVIDDRIDDKVEENPEKFLALVNDDNLIERSMIVNALDKGILLIKDGKILHGEMVLGYDKDSATKVLAKDPTLQAIIKAKISGDMDLIKKALEKRTKIEK